MWTVLSTPKLDEYKSTKLSAALYSFSLTSPNTLSSGLSTSRNVPGKTLGSKTPPDGLMANTSPTLCHSSAGSKDELASVRPIATSGRRRSVLPSVEKSPSPQLLPGSTPTWPKESSGSTTPTCVSTIASFPLKVSALLICCDSAASSSLALSFEIVNVSPGSMLPVREISRNARSLPL